MLFLKTIPLLVDGQEIITGFYGWLRLLTRGELADPLLFTLFTKTTTIYEPIEAILMITKLMPTKSSYVTLS